MSGMYNRNSMQCFHLFQKYDHIHDHKIAYANYQDVTFYPLICSTCNSEFQTIFFNTLFYWSSNTGVYS